MARSAKKATKTIRQQLTELKRQQRERMKAAGETPQSLKKKRDQRRAEAARPRTSKASRTTPNGETTVPKRPGKDLIKSKPRQLPARLKDLDTPKELRNKFPVKKGTSDSKLREIINSKSFRTAQNQTKVKQILGAAGLLAGASIIGDKLTGGGGTKKATAGEKKSGSITVPATKTGKPRRLKGKFMPRVRPFGGKIARALLGKDEQFGGEAGLIDPDLGLGIRRKGQKTKTKVELTSPDGKKKVIQKNKGGPIRKMSKGGTAKPRKMSKGGPLRKMSKGGMTKPRKMSKGGNLKKVGADQKGLQKLPTAVRNKMGYMKDGGMPKKKGYAKGGPVKPRKMSKGGMTKPRKMSKGGMTKPRKMSKGGTARRGSPRGVGIAKRGFGKALRGR